MTTLRYEIVEHDGGFAYRVDGTFSETFPTHEAAHRAAELAARRQHRGEDADRGIAWEDKQGRWHEELASGRDRPQTEVTD